MKTKIEANNPIMEWALVFILSMAKGFTPFSTKISTTPAKLESSIVHSCNNFSLLEISTYLPVYYINLVTLELI